MYMDQLKMTQSVHDRPASLRNHSYPGRRLDLKLALDVWYEAWGRTGEREIVGATGHGDAAIVAEPVVHDGTHPGGGVRDPREVAGDVGPPLCAGP